MSDSPTPFEIPDKYWWYHHITHAGQCAPGSSQCAGHEHSGWQQQAASCVVVKVAWIPGESVLGSAI
eukprot:3575781-Rhodomonas_salina.2